MSSTLLNDILSTSYRINNGLKGNYQAALEDVIEHLSYDQDDYRIQLLDVAKGQEKLLKKMEDAESTNKRKNIQHDDIENTQQCINDDNNNITGNEFRSEELRNRKKVMVQSIKLCNEELERLERDTENESLMLSDIKKEFKEAKEKLKEEKLMNGLYQHIFGLEWRRSGSLWSALKSKRRLFQWDPNDNKSHLKNSMSCHLISSGIEDDAPVSVPMMVLHYIEGCSKDTKYESFFVQLADIVWDIVGSKHDQERSMKVGGVGLRSR